MSQKEPVMSNEVPDVQQHFAGVASSVLMAGPIESRRAEGSEQWSCGPDKSLCNLCVLLYEVRSTSTSYTHMIPSRDVMRSYLHLCFPFVVAPVQTKTFSFSASSRRNDTEHPVPQNPPLMGEGVFSTLCVYSLICSCAFFSCRVSLPPSVLPQLNPSQVHEKVLSRVFLLNIRAPPHTDQNAYFDSLGHACKRL